MLFSFRLANPQNPNPEPVQVGRQVIVHESLPCSSSSVNDS